MKSRYKEFLIRDWHEDDRASVIAVISSVLAEYGLQWEPEGADMDAIEVEKYYRQVGGEFWIVEYFHQLVGTAAYHPTSRGENAVEIRKMYLLPAVRRQGLGTFLLKELESEIASRNFQQIWVETATVLKEAVKLYESNGYQPATGVETPRCDRLYVKYLAAHGQHL
ncbi:MAG: GNAT family N-acetyltransferase [Hormoscilla sp. SP5CHS1]|nr:GNAT family N-acetyltransferase [Hormoscilla sp. SP12CHS1]MBC6452531.1 GNAT family N-acetyltransferase [Hormoscilla sp. SP5CHS1]